VTTAPYGIAPGSCVLTCILENEHPTSFDWHLNLLGQNMEIIVHELFAGQIAPLGKRAAPSSIAKTSIAGPWQISAIGLVGDMQADRKNHGGPEKALHHYAYEHYSIWAAEIPDAGRRLSLAPAFGENISTTGLTEADVCIGDIFRLGEAVLQVSQGRQPCWKLNEWFDVPDMARRVQTSGRTGWYYRVLEEGEVLPGATLTRLERDYPDWPLSRLSTLLYRDTQNYDALAEMAVLSPLADNWRTLAQRRIDNRRTESWDSRLVGE